MTERRTTRRYDLSLPVMVRLPVEKEVSSRSGKTRDISTRGVYFIIENNMSPGAELDLTMTLPAEVTGGTEVLVRAMGRVVRIENRAETGEQHIGIAAIIERYEIVRGDLSVS
jgi:hypothetical protein